MSIYSCTQVQEEHHSITGVGANPRMAINAATDNTGSDVSGVYDDRCLHCYCFSFFCAVCVVTAFTSFLFCFSGVASLYSCLDEFMQIHGLSPIHAVLYQGLGSKNCVRVDPISFAYHCVEVSCKIIII